MGLDKLRNLYQAVILDHANHPRNKHKLTNPTTTMTVHNPTCGDTINLQVQVKNNRLADIAFTGSGCSISQASASMMTEAVKGKSTQEAQQMAKTFSDMAIGKYHYQKDLKKLGDAQVLINIMQFPARIKCATISWWALERALAKEDQTGEQRSK
ncbi:NifU family protein [Limosilactobacillus frumenti DSM 13145]|uniref:NifU family protein n=1 Tax=Limosilactobacillus frumenti DSM 13145 TaxID=1423746 RepID=A0A0R1P494_9LACO|nr:SUF system NifU family Fe-S cluster assembly protein [Limosilactobacillus frumenti]KRL27119.1 NifU family protein [Limosilactobacillus frumenti DSM 13145]MBA2913808.1 SUF system NifU family Fe-S cluster assembly protein [Limosilactobacillus frumenti]QFG72587.1 SUF system NifU family Fe-S cluster assembly protein [Limosilactobacillus frumenti]